MLLLLLLHRRRRHRLHQQQQQQQINLAGGNSASSSSSSSRAWGWSKTSCWNWTNLLWRQSRVLMGMSSIVYGADPNPHSTTRCCKTIFSRCSCRILQITTVRAHTHTETAHMSRDQSRFANENNAWAEEAAACDHLLFLYTSLVMSCSTSTSSTSLRKLQLMCCFCSWLMTTGSTDCHSESVTWTSCRIIYIEVP